MPRGIDADALLAGYLLALESQPLEALQSVVLKLVKGTWPEEVKFCPRPPELANMVREEARRIREASAPMLTYRPAEKPPMVALMQKKYADRKVLAENIDRDGFRPVDWPVGACFVPLLGKVFAAEEAKPAKKESGAYSHFRKMREPPRAFHEPIQDVDYWEKINAIKDAPNLTEEQMAFRRKIGKQIDGAAQEEQRAAE
ncbi:hypothetical protein EVB56_057 [Rhizobium phage RHph_Y1_10]|nr:hypothetical protein EVB56_057 [Rhizobium phage RHph_Y1_10]